MNIVFDLDGTLICSKRRLYELFSYLLGGYKLSFSEYWGFKLSGCTNQQILAAEFGFSVDETQWFVERWMELIEHRRYLSFDSIIDNVPDFLSVLNKDHKLYLCTARQSTAGTIEQLGNLYILDFFERVFVTEQKYSKEQLLRNSGIEFAGVDWVVGDTGHDILTGKALGLKTCAVLTGFMSESGLIKYNPDCIFSDVTKFIG